LDVSCGALDLALVGGGLERQTETRVQDINNKVAHAGNHISAQLAYTKSLRYGYEEDLDAFE
jgi:hypothetical protein